MSAKTRHPILYRLRRGLPHLTAGDIHEAAIEISGLYAEIDNLERELEDARRKVCPDMQPQSSVVSRIQA